MKKGKKVLTFLVSAFMCMSLAACGTAKTESDKNATKKNMTNQTDKADKDIKNSEHKNAAIGENINNTDDKMAVENKDLDARAQKIVKKVDKIKGIKKSYVAISNKTALIGLDIDKTYEGKLTEDLKKEVQDAVKKTDAAIDKVGVTADADLTERIKKVRDDIRAGKPLSGLGTEIEEIFRRIIPTK